MMDFEEYIRQGDRNLLYRAVQKIEVKAINGTSGDSLTYYEIEK